MILPPTSDSISAAGYAKERTEHAEVVLGKPRGSFGKEALGIAELRWHPAPDRPFADHGTVVDEMEEPHL